MPVIVAQKIGVPTPAAGEVEFDFLVFSSGAARWPVEVALAVLIGFGGGVATRHGAWDRAGVVDGNSRERMWC